DRIGVDGHVVALVGFHLGQSAQPVIAVADVGVGIGLITSVGPGRAGEDAGLPAQVVVLVVDRAGGRVGADQAAVVVVLVSPHAVGHFVAGTVPFDRNRPAEGVVGVGDRFR